MTMHEIIEKCFREALGRPLRNRSLGVGERLLEDHGMSSLQMVTFVTGVCEQTGVPLTAFTERDIAGIKTVGDLIALIGRAQAR